MKKSIFFLTPNAILQNIYFFVNHSSIQIGLCHDYLQQLIYNVYGSIYNTCTAYPRIFIYINICVANDRYIDRKEEKYYSNGLY